MAWYGARCSVFVAWNSYVARIRIDLALIWFFLSLSLSRVIILYISKLDQAQYYFEIDVRSKKDIF